MQLSTDFRYLWSVALKYLIFPYLIINILSCYSHWGNRDQYHPGHHKWKLHWWRIRSNHAVQETQWSGNHFVIFYVYTLLAFNYFVWKNENAMEILNYSNQYYDCRRHHFGNKSVTWPLTQSHIARFTSRCCSGHHKGHYQSFKCLLGYKWAHV